jgi:hypothetical protein
MPLSCFGRRSRKAQYPLISESTVHPVEHQQARGLISGPKFERKYQEDLALYGPRVAEDMHMQRRRRARM